MKIEENSVLAVIDVQGGDYNLGIHLIRKCVGRCDIYANNVPVNAS
jgi:hypothetical protein